MHGCTISIFLVLQPFQYKARMWWNSHHCDYLRKYGMMTICEITSLAFSLQPLSLRHKFMLRVLLIKITWCHPFHFSSAEIVLLLLFIGRTAPSHITVPCCISFAYHMETLRLSPQTPQAQIDWNRSVALLPPLPLLTAQCVSKMNLEWGLQNTKHFEKVSQYLIALSTQSLFIS